MCLRMSDLRLEVSTAQLDDVMFDADRRGKGGTPGSTCIYIRGYHGREARRRGGMGSSWSSGCCFGHGI